MLDSIPSLTAFLSLLLALSSCVTPYQPETETMPSALVVEGLITDQPGPYTVKLTQTADYSFKSVNLLVIGATVTLSDNAGNQEVLREVGVGGTYQTSVSGIKGTAGRTYRLTIQTRDGKRYESEPELLKATPPIQNVYAEFREDPYGLTSDRISGWDVYVDTKDPEAPGDYYRWIWTHYEPIVVCQSIENPRTGIITDFSCCSPCWDIVRCYDCINVNSDASINGQAISRQFILRVPFTSFAPYYLEIEQQSLSRGAYQFMNSVKKLTQNTGGLFDAAPASVRGNVRCISHPDEIVFGYFGAAGIAVVPLTVERTQGIGNPPIQRTPNIPQPSACVPCQNNEYRTAVKPQWFQ
ncbi:hypothetical protein GCM10023189_04450 [Nibrella saemangeumensis]|uniref:DUF4249 domain-containing protein n=1 Tax=Nibrella saemangeumensis TaxID=1084526 RepID=A0ABP8MEE0_9BACT